jgi:hypothetical protein
VRIHCFSFRDPDGSDLIVAGRMASSDHKAARAFGSAFIRDMLREQADHVPRIMEVATGGAVVFGLRFKHAAKVVQRGRELA